MKAITETIISVMELVEAEGRLLKQRTLQALLLALMMMVAMAFIFGSLVLLLAAIYQWLTLYWPLPAVLLALSVLCLGISGGLAWGTLYINRKLKL